MMVNIQPQTTHLQDKRVVVISGPSGSGESTITNEIMGRYPERFKRLVTATTRPPRGNEQNGVDYYFFSKEVFFDKKARGEILESTYLENRDTYYGTYAPDLADKLTAGYIVIVNTDIVGTKFFKERYHATTIFVLTSDVKELALRLRKRNPGMSAEELAQRAENAAKEVEDERPFYDYEVVNAEGKLGAAVDEVISILRRERYVL